MRNILRAFAVMGLCLLLAILFPLCVLFERRGVAALLLSCLLAVPASGGMVGGLDAGVGTYSDRNSDCSYMVWAGPVWTWEGILGAGLVVYATPEDWNRSNTALTGEVCLGGLIGLPRWCPLGVGAYLPFSAYDARVGYFVDVVRWEW